MSKKGPYLPWYPGDIQRDSALQSVSLSAFGLWHKMLYYMYGATPYGHLAVNGRVIPDHNLPKLFGCTADEFWPLLTELEEANIFSRTAEGMVYSRRMVRDAKRAETAAVNGKRGGNPKLLHSPKQDNPQDNRGVNTEDNRQVIRNPALCFMQYASDSDSERGMGSGEGSDPTRQLDWPFTGAKFMAAWWDWQAHLASTGMLYANRTMAQAAIDALRDYDEDYATTLLVTATNSRYRGFVFNDTLAKYRRLKATKTRTTATDAARGTIQDRTAPVPSLKDFMAKKDPNPARP